MYTPETDLELSNVLSLLRPYQTEAVKFGLKMQKVIFDIDMGLGKTIVSLTSTVSQKPKKVLIICSKNAVLTWSKEVVKWYPSLSDPKVYTRVLGNKKKREKLWKEDSIFYACTHLTFLSDSDLVASIKWDVIIFDEFHRIGLRNRKSQVYKALKPITRKTKSLFMLSGTPVSKGPQDLWAPLHLLNYKLFKSYWSFVNMFCVTYEGIFGKEIVGAQNTEKLRSILKDFMFRAKCSNPEIAKQMPKLNRIPLYVDLPPKFSRMYDDLDAELLAEYDDKYIIAQNSLTRDIKLQQMLVCPKIIDPTLPYGPFFEYLTETILNSSVEDRHCVIFTPYRKAVNYLIDFLHGKGVERVYRLWGGMHPDEMADAISEYKAHSNILDKNGNPSIMICTTKTAQSFDLETSSVCYHLGYEWDQNDNEQAEGRLRRLINKAAVIRSFYLLSDKPIDERKMDVLGTKTNVVKRMYQDKKLND